MKSDRQRIEELESQVDSLLRAADPGPCRVAAPLNIRNGWWLGSLNATLSQGGTVSVAAIGWLAGEWTHLGVDFTARDFYLNVGESVANGTLCEIDWYRNVWVVTNWYCLVGDAIDDVAATEAGDYLTMEDGSLLEFEGV